MYVNPTLGVTSLPAKSNGDWTAGLALERGQAYISVIPSEIGCPGTSSFLELVLTLSVHELGHVLGLAHHGIKIVSGNKYCPMTFAHIKEAMKNRVPLQECISLLDPRNFCDGCAVKLQTTYQTRNFRSIVD